MAHDVDLVVRNGLVIDGGGAAPFEADVGVAGADASSLSARWRMQRNGHRDPR